MSLRGREYHYYYEDDEDEELDTISRVSEPRSSNGGSYYIKRYVIAPDSRSHRDDSGSEILPRRLSTMDRRQEYEYVDIDRECRSYIFFIFLSFSSFLHLSPPAHSSFHLPICRPKPLRSLF